MSDTLTTEGAPSVLEELAAINDEALLSKIESALKAFDALDSDAKKRAAKGGIINLVAQLSDPILLDELRESTPKRMGMSKSGYDKAVKDARAAIEEQRSELRVKMRKEAAAAAAVEEGDDGAESPVTSAPHDYVIHQGMIQIETVSIDEGTGEEKTSRTPICTFTAQIIGEARDEFDNVSYKITGTTIRSGNFETEVAGEVFGTPSKLKIALETAAGALETVMPKMEAHLGAAIKLLSENTNVERYRYYDRTGWIDGKFYMPGRESAGVKVELPVVLPYQSSGVTDMPAALDALRLLLQALPPNVAPIMLAAVMGPPLAALAGLSNHRYALMLKGQTGTYKTGAAQAYMSVWGAGFLNKDCLVKLGTGGTGNAIMHLATRTNDMPIYLDNYKSNTDRENEFIKLLHVTLEGGERLRMETRRNALRDIRMIQTWPIITGEDAPATDPATTARLLLIGVKKNPNGIPAGILAKSAKHLSQIGAATLDWLEADGGRSAAADLDDVFTEHQRTWRAFLLKCNQSTPNVDRVASTLALNQSVLTILAKHPTFGHVLQPYLTPHVIGLQEIAQQMSGAATDGLEAVRFMVAIREMLAAGRAILIKNDNHLNRLPRGDYDKIIGWDDDTGGAYLLPTIARMMVEKVMNVKLSEMSDGAIGNQLVELGWIKSCDPGRSRKTVRLAGRTQKVLHLNGMALAEQSAQEHDAASGDDDGGEWVM